MLRTYVYCGVDCKAICTARCIFQGNLSYCKNITTKKETRAMVAQVVAAAEFFQRLLHKSVSQRHIWSSTNVPFFSFLPQSANLSADSASISDLGAQFPLTEFA